MDENVLDAPLDNSPLPDAYKSSAELSGKVEGRSRDGGVSKRKVSSG